MITDSDFQHIVAYMQKNYGIDLSQKRVLVGGRLENYLARNGYNSCAEYMAKVEHNPSGPEATDIVNALTTNHTYFMREFEHMEYLRQVVLPKLKVKEAARKDLRIWSAASSTGEEPYTIAMVLQDFFGLEHGWDTKILATDISTKVLQHAQQGKYLAEQIEPLPEKWKRRFLDKLNEDEYQFKKELRNEVIFRQFNLMNPLPFRRPFHVVFLRNVMIYFDEPTKLQLLRKIYDHMEPGGYLFIGTTEALNRKGTAFKYIEPSIYQK